MKRTAIGIGLILLAVAILFKDSLHLPEFGLPLWKLVLIVGFGINVIQSLLRRSYTSVYIGAAVIWMLLESHYHWLGIGLGTMFLVAILGGIGLGMIVKPRPKVMIYHTSQDDEGTLKDTIEGTIKDTIKDTIEGEFEQVGGESRKRSATSANDTVFGSATRYINDGYFTEVGGDVVFSNVSINFSNARMAGQRAIFSGDGAFSTVKLYVPADWGVEFSGDRVFSSVSNLRPARHSGKTLEITGYYVFSRLEIIYI